MKNWIGKTVMGIGILHSSLGLVMLSPIFIEILQEGFFNTVNQQPMREAFFWFEFFGVVLVILGALMDWLEKKEIYWPAFVNWSLLGMTALMLMIMPISGAWLMAIPLAGSFWRQRQVNILSPK